MKQTSGLKKRVVPFCGRRMIINQTVDRARCVGHGDSAVRDVCLQRFTVKRDSVGCGDM